MKIYNDIVSARISEIVLVSLYLFLDVSLEFSQYTLTLNRNHTLINLTFYGELQQKNKKNKRDTASFE